MDRSTVKMIDLESYEAEFAREELIYNCTEDLLVAMQDQGVSKADLAKMLNKSKANITQQLNGSRNMTLNSLSDIAYALGLNVKIKVESKTQEICFEKSHWTESHTNIDRKVINFAEYKMPKVPESIREYA